MTKPVKPIKLNKKQTLRIRAYAAREKITVSQAIDQALKLLEEQVQSERPRGGVTPDELSQHPLTKKLRAADKSPKRVRLTKSEHKGVERGRRDIANGRYSDGEEFFKSLKIEND